ncbi:hypothetical protein Glove_123g52 [Diversispora epigaea]|uniref:Uncharacterized protein n=1 Tax=Diversispora epigaea TaxID=1348612 RepID=A0A397J192_9GLOM|nr:hypothetical protein Glove_123g52 [Diversispora epigaea]
MSSFLGFARFSRPYIVIPKHLRELNKNESSTIITRVIFAYVPSLDITYIVWCISTKIKLYICNFSPELDEQLSPVYLHSTCIHENKLALVPETIEVHYLDDIYCPKYDLPIEVQGEQHGNHIKFFHRARAGSTQERRIGLCFLYIVIPEHLREIE